MAYKTFANGFPLPASDLNNFLMNQSVIVFADSAARTTAIPTPIQGMLTYLVDTSAYETWNGSAFVGISNPGDITAVTAGTGLTGGGTTGDVTLNVDTAQFITSDTVTTAQDLIVADGASSVTRLGVGANDQVLSVVAGAVAWADAGGGGGQTLISSTTLNASTITLSSIPQTYNQIWLEIVKPKFTVDSSPLEVRINSATTSTRFTYSHSANGGSINANSSNAQGAFRTPIFIASNSENNYYLLKFNNYASTNSTKSHSIEGMQGTPAVYIMYGAGSYDSNSAITSLQVIGVNQALATGTVNLYGVK